MRGDCVYDGFCDSAPAIKTSESWLNAIPSMMGDGFFSYSGPARGQLAMESIDDRGQ